MSMRKPIVALLGRPNVGKSTLFNGLTRSRDSIVSDQPGLTRDRNYGEAVLGGIPCRVIDTGGLLREEEALIDFRVDQQARYAAEEADVLLFLVDGKEGLNSVDEKIARELRTLGKPLILVVNKTDFGDVELLLSDFYQLGLSPMVAIAAEHRRGLKKLGDKVAEAIHTLPEAQFLVEEDKEDESDCDDNIALAVLGRPNAGKSTLLNRLLGEERLVASAQAGTTRDAISIPYTAENGKKFVLIDTAGIRRKSKTHDKIEKFSIVKALEAVERANVVVLVLDAQEGVAEQDAHLLGEITRRGRALIVAVNKWDSLDEEKRKEVQAQLERKLHFVDYAKIFYISALYGNNIRNLLPTVERVYLNAMRELSTNQLTEALQLAYRRHQPPLVSGRSIKLQYAHQGGKNPPHIIIHGTRTDNVPASYTQYLSKFFRRQFKLEGTPIRISYRDKFNPYHDKS